VTSTDTTIKTTSLADFLAFAGIALLILIVPMVKYNVPVGSVRIDSVIVCAALAVAMAVPKLVKDGLGALPRYGIELPAVFLLAAGAISIPMSLNPVDSMLTWTRYAVYVLLVYIIGMVSREEQNRRILMWLIGLSAFLTSITSYLQLAYSDLIGHVPGMRGLPASVATRVTGTYGNSNFYSEFLVLALGVAIGLLMTEKGFWKALALLLIADIGVTIVLTYTRGSWLGAAFGVALGLLISRPRWLLGFFGAGAAAFWAIPGAFERLQSIVNVDPQDSSGFRLRLWQIAGRIIADHPITGVGMGQFLPGFRQVVFSRPELNVGYVEFGAHNSYFTLAAETGVIGGLALLWLAVATVRQGLFLGTRDTKDQRFLLLNAGYVAGLAAFALNSMTSNSFQHPRAAVFFFVVAGLQAGLGSTHWFEATREPALHGSHKSKLLSGSFAARVAWWLGDQVRTAWAGSELRKVVVSRSRFDGALLRESWSARKAFSRTQA
jgi:O-antigen ligase